jgi:hypothetical protein
MGVKIANENSNSTTPPSVPRLRIYSSMTAFEVVEANIITRINHRVHPLLGYGSASYASNLPSFTISFNGF